MEIYVKILFDIHLFSFYMFFIMIWSHNCSIQIYRGYTRQRRRISLYHRVDTGLQRLSEKRIYLQPCSSHTEIGRLLSRPVSVSALLRQRRLSSDSPFFNHRRSSFSGRCFPTAEHCHRTSCRRRQCPF